MKKTKKSSTSRMSDFSLIRREDGVLYKKQKPAKFQRRHNLAAIGTIVNNFN